MTSPRTHPRVLSRGDTIGFILFLVGGVALAVASIVQTVVALVQALPNRSVTLHAPFAATTAQAPIGPDGALIPVQLDSATLTVPSLQPPALIALVIGQVLFAVTVVTVVALLLVLCFGILRGQIFRRRHTVLVTVAGVVTVLGMYFVPFFHNMAVNGALALLSERTYDRAVVGTADVTVIFAVAFVAALAGTAFAVGERLQRDTEGLV